MTILELYLYVAKSYKQHEPSEFDGEVWQKVFDGYDVEIVKQAAIFWKSSSSQSQYMPTAQQLLEIIIPTKKELTADQAWAVAIAAGNEQNTVVWTKRTEKSFYEAAMPLLRLGDKVAARMAFKGAYDAINGMGEYTVSLGLSHSDRGQAISAAVLDDKISLKTALSLGAKMTDDALRHGVETNQLTWNEANKLRLTGIGVLALKHGSNDSREKTAAIEAIKKYLNRNQNTYNPQV